MKKIEPGLPIYRLKAGEPVASVRPGEVFQVGLINGFGESFPDVDAFERFMEGPDKAKKNHPCTGPILVEGAGEDCSLEIIIRSLQADVAYQCLSKSTGILKGEFEGREPHILTPRPGGMIDWEGILTRQRPSLGVVATLDDVSRSCGRCTENGGNMDFPFLSPGARLYLPVNHSEAQLAVGDMHMRQGFGELAGMALESDGRAILEVGVTEKIPYPVIDTNNWLVVVGFGSTREESVTRAVDNAIDYYLRQPALRGWSRSKVYQLLACTDIVPGNLTGNVSTHAVIIKKRDLMDPATGRSVFYPPKAISVIEETEADDLEGLFSQAMEDYFTLELFHEGDSREIRKIPGHEDLLIARLKPNVYSFEQKGAVAVDAGTTRIRVALDAHFSSILKDAGVDTSTLLSSGEYILMRNVQAAKRIEVVMKGSLIGSPKHMYPEIDKEPTLSGDLLVPKEPHKPYTRFDWRVENPGEDIVMPTGLADNFIDTWRAEQTAHEAFEALRAHLSTREMDLLDCCFFMSKNGRTICGEVSPDNLGNIIYKGSDPEIQAIFDDRSKGNIIKRWTAICRLLNVTIPD